VKYSVLKSYKRTQYQQHYLLLKLLLSPTRLDLKKELKALGRWQREIERAQAPNDFTFAEQSMAQQPVKLWQARA
jgi:transposase-like protein